MSKSMKTYLLLHPNYASPLLNEKAITLLPEIRVEVGLQRIGICAYWKLYQTYKFRIFPELLKGLCEAGAMEIVEDRLVTVQRGFTSEIRQRLVDVKHTGHLFVDPTIKLT